MCELEMPNRIIFIEGVSGVGKTTSAKLLQEKLKNMGHNVSCFFEGDKDNPLDPFGGTYPPEMSFSEFEEAYIHCWQSFTRNQYSKFLVLDGTLLHHQINDLIRNYNASDEAIIKHLTALISVIRTFNPIVFYLASHCVEARLVQAEASRGKASPAKEKISFWENRKRVDLNVLDAIPIESHVLHVDNGWDSVIENMLNILCYNPHRT